MMLKTTTSLAFAAICLTAIVNLPVHAQMAGTYAAPPGYSGTPGYQENTFPNGSTTGSYVPQPDQPNMPSSAGSGAGAMTNGPQASRPVTSSSRTARQNVIQSQRYDRGPRNKSRFPPSAYAQGMRSD